MPNLKWGQISNYPLVNGPWWVGHIGRVVVECYGMRASFHIRNPFTAMNWEFDLIIYSTNVMIFMSLNCESISFLPKGIIPSTGLVATQDSSSHTQEVFSLLWCGLSANLLLADGDFENFWVDGDCQKLAVLQKNYSLAPKWGENFSSLELWLVLGCLPESPQIRVYN